MNELDRTSLSDPAGEIVIACVLAGVFAWLCPDRFPDWVRVVCLIVGFSIGYVVGVFLLYVRKAKTKE